jgi:hypothetical protein
MTIDACELEGVRGGFSQCAKAATVGGGIFGTLGFAIGANRAYGMMGRVVVGGAMALIGAGAGAAGCANQPAASASQAK